MEIYEVFSTWRKNNNANGSWALAWFLANEFCKRYYSSHGIVPRVINHDGLGYYGILLSDVNCSVNSSSIGKYGRLTMSGNVENWRTGEPGSHGLKTIDMCNENVATEEIITKSIEYMGIEALPRKSHLNCRHKRWGSSYEICFEVAAILAIKHCGNMTHDEKNVYVTNNVSEVERELKDKDPKWNMKEHMGAFCFTCGDKSLVVAGDGRVLDGSESNIWLQYMNGKSTMQIASYIENCLSFP